MRRVLFLNAGSLSVMQWTRGRVDAEAEFDADPEGIERFAVFLAKHPNCIYYMLADVAEENFQFDAIPYLHGRNRIALIKRKLARYYPATPFTVALSLGRQADGRRDERMLFTALTRPQQFEPWLKAVKNQEAALAGLFSLPQIAPSLSACCAAEACFLFVSVTRAGLRQTFIENGHVRFSRLTSLAVFSPEEAARACAHESAKVFQYLDAQQWVTAGTPLPIYVLLHSDEFETFRAHCRDGARLAYRYVDVEAHAAQGGLKTRLPDSRSEALFAHWLIRHTPRAQFAHADTRHVFRLRRVRSALHAAGAAALAVCLAFTGWQMLDLRGLKAATASLKEEVENHDRRYRAILASLPNLPMPAERLLALTRRHEMLLQQSPGPAPLYRHVAAALDDTPEIVLQRLNWAVMESDGSATSPAQQRGVFAVADIEADLPEESSGDLLIQTALIDRFADRLRRNPSVTVRILTLPSGLDGNKAMLVNNDAGYRPIPRMTLRVAQRLETTWP